METPLNQEKKGNFLTNWLDGIQQESWQLELLISGFSIFLLFGGYDWLWDLEQDLIVLQQSSSQFFSLDTVYYGMRMAYGALLTCLLIHVVLRGMWIAAIGLRSVSGDIEYEHFKYQSFFTKRLREGIGSFDDYINRLERYCSILFSFAFLIIFCFLGVALYTFLCAAFSQSVDWLINGNNYSNSFGIDDALAVLALVIGLSYTIDFITFGYLKRVRWWGKTYYYVYIFMGWLTLARFYRPLYYNLIDNTFGRKFARALPISIFLIMVLVSLRFNGYAYTPGFLEDGTTWIDPSSYDDQGHNSTNHIWRMSLSSRYVANNYVELFIPYIPINDDATLQLIAPDLIAGRKIGFYMQGGLSLGDRNVQGADNQQLLAAFQEMRRVYVNDTLSPVVPRFYYHSERRQHGLLYPIPTHELPAGEHRLRVGKRNHLRDTVSYSEGRVIYFYK